MPRSLSGHCYLLCRAFLIECMQTFRTTGFFYELLKPLFSGLINFRWGPAEEVRLYHSSYMHLYLAVEDGCRRHMADSRCYVPYFRSSTGHEGLLTKRVFRARIRRAESGRENERLHESVRWQTPSHHQRRHILR